MNEKSIWNYIFNNKRDKTSVRQRLDKISKRIFEYLKD